MSVAGLYTRFQKKSVRNRIPSRFNWLNRGSLSVTFPSRFRHELKRKTLQCRSRRQPSQRNFLRTLTEPFGRSITVFLFKLDRYSAVGRCTITCIRTQPITVEIVASAHSLANDGLTFYGNWNRFLLVNYIVSYCNWNTFLSLHQILMHCWCWIRYFLNFIRDHWIHWNNWINTRFIFSKRIKHQNEWIIITEF